MNDVYSSILSMRVKALESIVDELTQKVIMLESSVVYKKISPAVLGDIVNEN